MIYRKIDGPELSPSGGDLSNGRWSTEGNTLAEGTSATAAAEQRECLGYYRAQLVTIIRSGPLINASCDIEMERTGAFLLGIVRLSLLEREFELPSHAEVTLPRRLEAIQK